MQISFVQIFWIVLIVLSLASILKIIKQKEFSVGNFIRVEDVDDDEWNIGFIDVMRVFAVPIQIHKQSYFLGDERYV